MTDITDTDRLEFIQSEAEGNGLSVELRNRTYGTPGSPIHNAILTEWSINGRTWHPTFRDALDAGIRLDQAFMTGADKLCQAIEDAPPT